jgi:hypothetical protein
VIGIALRDTWGEAILATLGLPSESFMDDIVTGVALSGYGAVTFASTYLPRRAPLAQ